MGFFDSCLVCEHLLWKPAPFCSHCENDLFNFQLIHRQVGELNVFSLLHYFGAAERLVAACKSPSASHVRRVLATRAAEKLALELVAPVAGVIPMPARIFGARDHAYEVGEFAAEKFRVPLCGRFLERADTGVQKEKTLDERAQTRFRLHEKLSDVRSGMWILADDVITTGSTLIEAWRALGEPPAVGLTLASTPRLRDHVVWP